MLDRRQFLAAGGAAAALGGGLAALPAMAQQAAEPRLTWTMFSRHLQWLTTPEVSAAQPFQTGVLVAQTARQLGFGAVDLTVRRGGHVDPAYILERLPLMLRGVQAGGSRCEQITTDITDATTAVASDTTGVTVAPSRIVEIAARLGIKRYRCSPASYTTSATGPFGDEVKAQLAAVHTKLEALERLNRRVGGIQAIFHTFSGGRVGSSVWDLLLALEGIDPAMVAMNYDIGHLTSEGASGAWRTNLRAARPYWGAIGLKDVLLSRSNSGTVSQTWVAAGTGLVQWQSFFQLLLQAGYRGSCETQYEYLLNGVSLNSTFWPAGLPQALPPQVLLAQLKAELDFYKASATAAGWQAHQMV